jgi:hypothetical protein
MLLEEWKAESGEISMTGPDLASEAAYIGEHSMRASLLIDIITVIME